MSSTQFDADWCALDEHAGVVQAQGPDCVSRKRLSTDPRCGIVRSNGCHAMGVSLYVSILTLYLSEGAARYPGVEFLSHARKVRWCTPCA